MVTEPFDQEEVITLCTSLQQEPGFTDRKSYLENWDSLIKRETDVGVQGISEVLEARSPVLSVHADRFRNRMRAADIVISVAPKSTKQEHVEAAQRVENFDYRSFHDFARKRTSAVHAPDDVALDFQVKMGCGPRGIDWADDVLEKLVGKNVRNLDELANALGQGGFQGNPFQMHAPHPGAVYWEPNFEMVAEVGERKIASLIRAFPEYAQSVSFKDATSEMQPENEGMAVWGTGVATLYHLETEQFIYDVAEDAGDSGEKAMLSFWPNPAGRPRYSFAAGHLTSSVKPHERFQPLIHPLFSLVQLKNIFGTLMSSSALLTGRPLLQEVPDGRQQQDFLAMGARPTEAQRVVSLELGAEAVPQAREGYHWEFMAPPPLEQVLFALQAVDAEIEKFGFPGSLSPDTPLDATSGYDRAKQMEAATDFLDPPLTNLAGAWYENFMIMAEMLQKVNRDVHFVTIARAQGEGRGGQVPVTVKPSDFDEIDLEVSFKSIPATVQFAENEQNMVLYEKKLMSKGDLLATLFPDPVAAQERIDMDIVAEVAREEALQFAIAAGKQLAPGEFQQALNELGAPSVLPTNGAAGGPAPGETVRRERPPGGAVPGVGAPVVPPTQRQGGVPPDLGGGTTGAAP